MPSGIYNLKENIQKKSWEDRAIGSTFLQSSGDEPSTFFWKWHVLF